VYFAQQPFNGSTYTTGELNLGRDNDWENPYGSRTIDPHNPTLHDFGFEHGPLFADPMIFE
jgi:hypothetical protein